MLGCFPEAKPTTSTRAPQAVPRKDSSKTSPPIVSKTTSTPELACFCQKPSRGSMLREPKIKIVEWNSRQRQRTSMKHQESERDAQAVIRGLIVECRSSVGLQRKPASQPRISKTQEQLWTSQSAKRYKKTDPETPFRVVYRRWRPLASKKFLISDSLRHPESTAQGNVKQERVLAPSRGA